MILGKGVSLRSVDAEETVQPVEVREICRQNAENFQLEPAHFQDDGHQTDRQEDAGAQAIHAVLAQTYREIAEQKRQTGDELRAVTQRVQRHRHGNEQHESAIDGEPSEIRREDTHRADVVNAVGAEKEQRPAAADPCAAKQAITLALFQRNAAHKKQDRREIRNAGFAEGAESSKLINTKERDTDNQDNDA